MVCLEIEILDKIEIPIPSHGTLYLSLMNKKQFKTAR